MATARRALALLACAAALASSAAPASAGPASAGARSRQAHRQVAHAALTRLLAGHSYDGLRLSARDVVRLTVCFHGECVSRQVKAEPTCDPSAGVCLGTALRAWRLNRFTIVEAELA